MTPYQTEKWRQRVLTLFGIGILERFTKPKLWWFMFFAKPLPEAPDFSTVVGGHVYVWVAHSDSSVAERIARKVISDEQWLACTLSSRKLVTRWTYTRRKGSFKNYAEQSLLRFDEAVRIGHSAEFHRIPRDPDE
jgi:hypothetical protein